MEKASVEWMSLEQVQEYLGISEPTVRRMLRDKQLPGAVKVGPRLWRVHLATLREALLKLGSEGQ